MITEARIAEDIKPAGLDWITALRAPAIRGLIEGGAFQMSLFDDRDMAAITSPDFPGERLILCRNHALAAERSRKREDLLRATERDLAAIAAAVRRKRAPLRGKAEIGLAVGAVIDRRKMAKHFALTIADTSFAFARRSAEIAAEAALDGLYVVRTSLPAAALDDAATVRSYKSLSFVVYLCPIQEYVARAGVQAPIMNAFGTRLAWVGAVISTFVAAIVFGAMHISFGVLAVLLTTLVGLYWGIVFVQTRSVLAVSVSHIDARRRRLSLVRLIR
jgi:hypothetical protein